MTQIPLQRDADLREQVERLKSALDAATVDLQNAQTDVVAKNRKIGALERELEKVWNKHVPTREIEEVFGHWLVACGKDPRRTKLTKERVKVIREAIKTWGVDDCKRALDGLASRPHVGKNGRSSQPYPGSSVRNDVDHALSTAKRFETCLSYLEEPETPARHLESVPADKVTKHDPWSRPLDRAVAAIRREFGVGAATPMYRSEDPAHPAYWDVEWWCACPFHPVMGHPLRLREFGYRFGGEIEAVCAQGCLPSLILGEVRKFEWRRVNGEILAPPDELLERWALREAVAA